MQDFLAAAARFINTTSGHIFLTGKAGTGKTTFLKNLGKLTHKTHIVVAPTGIAALNAGGVTIHSQFLLPPLTFLPDRSLPREIGEGGNFINQDALARKHPLNSARKKVLRSIDLLVIDEVSMLRADLLDAIDYRMKAARGNFRESFGGVQVLFIGDLYQLPPVVKSDAWEALSGYYSSMWFYEAKALRDDPPVYIELDEIFRQNDAAFINILNNLRNNVPTTEDISTLNLRYKSPDEIQGLSEIITLTTHNYKADELNQKALRSLPAPSHIFDAQIEGDFPESMYPVLPQLELKEGAQIMFVRNDNEGKMYFNGKLATVIQISGDSVWVEMAESHVRYQLKREHWENRKYTLHEETHDLEEDIAGTFEQYPVKLAWAITVHKSQGLTFDKAIIDVGQAFADGQVYVALSRLRSLEGLVLRTPINPSVISTDRQVVAFAQTNHRPGQMGEEMRKRQQQFIRQLISGTFDFTALIKEIRYIGKDQEEGFAKSVLTQIDEALSKEQANTERFRQQLADLLPAAIGTGDTSPLLDRLRKGSHYYNELLFQNLKILLHHLEVVKPGKRVKTYVTQLTDLDTALSKKRQEVDKIATLTEAILLGQDQIDFEVLAKQRSQERVQLLSEIRRQAEAEAPPERKRKPRVRKSKNGDDRRTLDITLELLDRGMTVAQIAETRGLVAGTIESHLAAAVETGRLEISRFVTEDEMKEIVRAREALPEEATSKTLFEKLNGRFSYGKLRAVVKRIKQ